VHQIYSHSQRCYPPAHSSSSVNQRDIFESFELLSHSARSPSAALGSLAAMASAIAASIVVAPAAFAAASSSAGSHVAACSVCRSVVEAAHVRVQGRIPGVERDPGVQDCVPPVLRACDGLRQYQAGADLWLLGRNPL
jgi:hypothetical protein